MQQPGIGEKLRALGPGPSRAGCQCLKTLDIGMDNVMRVWRSERLLEVLETSTARTGFMSDPDVRYLRRSGTIIKRKEPETG